MNRGPRFKTKFSPSMDATAQPESARLRLRRFSAIELLIALAVLFVLFPFIDTSGTRPLLETILLTIVLLSAVLAISGRGPVLITAALLAFLALLGRWIPHYRPGLVPPEVFLIGGILFVFFVIAN